MRHVRRRPVSEWAVVRTFSYQHEAEIVKSVLEGSGIEAITSSDDCGALDPALGLVRGVKVLVATEQLEQAERVLGAAQEDGTAGPSSAD
ncbi:MAG: DUF2007 domain-containing protein [Acidobacteria bacterium]|nr:DUF2007 domain-containing protein [Acidobacteriota bacterium]